MDPQGLATFPGIEQVISAEYVLSHGITPGVATLEIAPQANFTATVGALEFVFGSARLVFPDCRVVQHSFQADGRGQLVRLQVLDRRWRWAFGQVSGVYNVRRRNGDILRYTARSTDPAFDDSERTPRQLARLCLAAMGEARFDVSDLPEGPRPAVDWQAANPAQALAQLAEDLGCRVVIQIDGSVAVRRAGVGGTLPVGDDVVEVGPSLDLPDRPDALTIVGGPNRYQADFELEAVGLDTDGSIRPIGELSYAPESGWAAMDLPHFNQIGVNARDLAAASVFRYYRIRTPAMIPGHGEIRSLGRILPIHTEQVESYSDERGLNVPLPAMVYGMWFTGAESLRNSASDATSSPAAAAVYQGRYTIDREQGIVRFADLVYRNNNNSGNQLEAAEATLRLRTSCGVRDDSRAWLRFQRSYRLNASGRSTKYLKHEELVLSHRPAYAGTGFAGAGVVRAQLDELQRAADFYLTAAAQEYEGTITQAVRYAGLKPINPDGAIQQVAWSVGLGGATTRASRNNEVAAPTIGHRERRFFERLKR